MSRERISREEWQRALTVLGRGIDETKVDLENCEDEDEDRRISLLLECARKVYRRLLDDKVLR